MILYCLAVFAAEINYPAISGQTPGDNLPSFARYAFMFFISFAGAIGFIAFIISGIKYLSSAGDPEKISEAKGRMLSAFWGTVLILSSYFILNSINPEITTLKEPVVEMLKPAEPMPSPPIDNIPTADLLERIRKLVENTKDAAFISRLTGGSIFVLTEHCDCMFTKPICSCQALVECPKDVPWYTTYKNLSVVGTIGDSESNWINLKPGDFVNSGAIGKIGPDGLNFSVGFAPGQAIDIYSKIQAPGGIIGSTNKQKPKENTNITQGNIQFILNTLQPPLSISHCDWYEEKTNNFEYWSQTWKCNSDDLTKTANASVMSYGSDIVTTVESVSNGTLVLKHQCLKDAKVESFSETIKPIQSLADVVCPPVTNPSCYYCPGDPTKNTNISLLPGKTDTNNIVSYCGPNSAGMDDFYSKEPGLDDNNCHKCYDFKCDAPTGVSDKCMEGEACRYYYSEGSQKNAVCCPNASYAACSPFNQPESRACCAADTTCIIGASGPSCCNNSTEKACGDSALANQTCCAKENICMGNKCIKVIDNPPDDGDDSGDDIDPTPQPPQQCPEPSEMPPPEQPSATPSPQNLACSPETCYAGDKYHPCGEDGYKGLRIYQKNMADEKDVIVYYKNRLVEERKDLKRDIEKFLNPTLEWFDNEINKKKQEKADTNQINFLLERKSWVEEEKTYKQDIMDRMERMERVLDDFSTSQKKLSELPDKCLTNVKLACSSNCTKDGTSGIDEFGTGGTFGCHDSFLGCKATTCTGGNPCPWGEIQSEDQKLLDIHNDIKAMVTNISVEIAEIKKERKPKYTIY